MKATRPFATVEAVDGRRRNYYDGDTWLVGQSATLYDMRTIVSRDTGVSQPVRRHRYFPGAADHLQVP
jgi:hypothetical protein